ncbi:Heterogeneous nuclear ribonucleoprotein H3 [Platysternon megacephalum]|uniref:Heterogeneous nuclear ribonucleoprotein H3 n=1 Tax=Platysternon megacephalum TaxID=55544 RepID=A0A4D9F1V3_9SAUR|nr:Heterogeneous nuclear ribonucleoprotein H3 [Platysternon megacephalum]
MELPEGESEPAPRQRAGRAGSCPGRSFPAGSAPAGGKRGACRGARGRLCWRRRGGGRLRLWAPGSGLGRGLGTRRPVGAWTGSGSRSAQL